MELAFLVVVACLFGVREYMAWRREQAWMRERGMLLNRIKPETAQLVTDEPVGPLVEAVDIFSDQDYWDKRGVTSGRSS